LERGIFNFALKEATKAKVVKKWENPIFAQIYVDRLRSIMSNLPHIVSQLQSGEMSPQAVAFMTHQEFQPDRWKLLLDQKMKRDASTANGEMVEASTDMYTCKKCKSKRCTYYEMQTRSADEPATVFITCLDCGKRWRS
jgi:transcription elongation factor S-II